nr:unnamed protein product [Callosobruchus analis]
MWQILHSPELRQEGL